MTPDELWALPTDEFNEWRRGNDLKNLFDCFKKVLPHFDEWLSTFNLTVDFILQTDQPGQFFYWEKDVYVVKSTDEHWKGYFFVPVQDEDHANQIEKINEKEKAEQQKFRPYLIWAKEKLGKKKIIKAGHSGEQETFRFNSYTAPDVPELSTATLNIGKTALKLGGVKVYGWGALLGRNLDFANLDFLHVDGDNKWSRETVIFYASCRKIKATNSDGNFFKFYQCHFEDLSVTNSELYSFEFSDCEMFRADFVNAPS